MVDVTPDQVREKAQAKLAEAEEVTKALVPEIKGELVEISAADAAQRAEIEKRMAELDMTDTQSIIKFGAKSQSELTAISEQMLDGVRNKDVGPAGDSLRKMVLTIKGFDIDALSGNGQGGLWAWLMSLFTPAMDLKEQF
ncbi:MAG: toxic anion resistance protein, partial [Pseudomonadota bacterium]